MDITSFIQSAIKVYYVYVYVYLSSTQRSLKGRVQLSGVRVIGQLDLWTEYSFLIVTQTIDFYVFDKSVILLASYNNILHVLFAGLVYWNFCMLNFHIWTIMKLFYWNIYINKQDFQLKCVDIS